MSSKLEVQCSKSGVRPSLFWAVIVKADWGVVVHAHTVRYTRQTAMSAFEKQFPFPEDAQKKFRDGKARLAQVIIAEPAESGQLTTDNGQLTRLHD